MDDLMGVWRRMNRERHGGKVKDCVDMLAVGKKYEGHELRKSAVPKDGKVACRYCGLSCVDVRNAEWHQNCCILRVE